MKTSEVAKLLAMASAFDNRSVGEANVSAWSAALGADMVFADAAEAVRQHFAATSDYLMPAHVNAYVKQLRRARVSACKTVPEIPPNLHQAQERAWLRGFWDAVKSGITDPTFAADEALSIVRGDDPLMLDPGVSGLLSRFAESKAIR